MSTWTHVAGVIRYDDIRVTQGTGLLKRYREALGAACTYKDAPDVWDRCTVPIGSEGSIQWELSENPNIFAMAAYVVTIWGDLRDYDDLDKIGEWLRRCTEGDGFLVRQAIIYAEVEGGDFRTWVYREGLKIVQKDSAECNP